MTGVYGSTITVTDAIARKDTSSSGGYDWPGNLTTFIWTDVDNSERDFEILFVDTPITGISGDTRGFVYDATSGTDFTIRAYDNNYTNYGGTVESPWSGAQVFEQSWDVPADKTEIDIPDITFGSNVSLLLFRNEGEHDVAIDNLTVTPIPEPTTIGLLGLGALSLLRRKRGA